MIKAVVGNREVKLGRVGWVGGQYLYPQVGRFSLSEVSRNSGETLQMDGVAFPLGDNQMISCI